MASCLQPCLHGCLVFAAKYLLPEPEGLGYAPEDSLCADRGAGVSYQEQAVEAACNKRKVEQFMLTGRGPSVWDEYNDFPVVVKFNRLPWAEWAVPAPKRSSMKGGRKSAMAKHAKTASSHEPFAGSSSDALGPLLPFPRQEPQEASWFSRLPPTSAAFDIGPGKEIEEPVLLGRRFAPLKVGNEEEAPKKVAVPEVRHLNRAELVDWLHEADAAL
ncbi:unnamed protein product [Effrenium voratum]|nr:unnamed protein product [Effrenium voratum]